MIGCFVACSIRYSHTIRPKPFNDSVSFVKWYDLLIVRFEALLCRWLPKGSGDVVEKIPMWERQDFIDGLRVRTKGKGPLTLLFVHGYTCSGTDWLGQIDALSSNYRCVTLDLPGHGESTAEPIPTMFALGEAVNKVKSSIGGNVVLIGHSLGCKTIREAYRQSSAQIVGMVFVDGSLYIGRPDAVANAAHDMVERGGAAAFLANLVEGMFSEKTNPAKADEVRARSLNMNVEFAKDLFLDSVAWDLERAVQTIRAIEVPVLVVQCMAFEASFGWRPIRDGEETPFMTLNRILTPSATLRILSGSGHFPMLDAPDHLNDTLNRYVASLPEAC